MLSAISCCKNNVAYSQTRLLYALFVSSYLHKRVCQAHRCGVYQNNISLSAFFVFLVRLENKSPMFTFRGFNELKSHLKADI